MAFGSNLSGRTSWLRKNPFCKCPGFYVLNSLLVADFKVRRRHWAFKTRLDGEYGDGRKGKAFASEGMLL